ncbi:hypothetical protein MMC28_009843 [Mycoblastus sanguinarius]|nr:hypothetical protein [Mycoblastus sanguinarius]
MCKEVSNWLDDHKSVYDFYRPGVIPQSTLKSTLPPVGQVRTTLQERGQFVTAHQLLKSEGYVSNYSERESVNAYEDFLASVRHLENSKDQALLTNIGTAQIMYAQELAGVGQRPDAENQLERAESKISRAVHISELTNEVTPGILMLFSKALSIMRPLPTLAGQVASHLALEGRARENRDFFLQRLHLRTAIAKNKCILNECANENALRTYREILMHYMALELDEMQEAYFCVEAVSDYGMEYIQRTGRNMKDLLRLIAEVEEKFPGFEIPLKQCKFMDLAAKAASHLGNTDLATRYKNKASRWKLESPAETPTLSVECTHPNHENCVVW